MSGETGEWARACATVGAAVWAAIAVLARVGPAWVGLAKIGAIELMFLFAPLVIVPLGMELVRVTGAGGWLLEWARRMQPVGAAAAVAAMLTPPGPRAAIVASGWLVVCGLMAVDGLLQLTRVIAGGGARATQARATQARATSSIAIAMAKIDLAVGGAWLVASRLGMRPMGIQEPIGLLTAVHFHFAGFATAMIAAATLRFVEGGATAGAKAPGNILHAGRSAKAPLFHANENHVGRGSQGNPTLSRRTRQGWGNRRGEWGSRILKVIVILVIGMPYVVAAGFVISPVLKMGAAMVFSASVAGLAIFLRMIGRRAQDRVARVLLQAAPVTVFAGMVLAGVYAIADFMKSDALPIPQMARTHGILNAVGFCLPGLLGWVIEISGQGRGVWDQGQ